jgi:hypothetical protein
MSADGDPEGQNRASGAAMIGGMADLQLVGSAEQGWRTQAVWERDEPILLPTADEVQIGGAVRPWAQLRPHLTAVPGLSPARWTADRWPAGSQFPEDRDDPRE